MTPGEKLMHLLRIVEELMEQRITPDYLGGPPPKISLEEQRDRDSVVNALLLEVDSSLTALGFS